VGETVIDASGVWNKDYRLGRCRARPERHHHRMTNATVTNNLMRLIMRYLLSSWQLLCTLRHTRSGLVR
jgi:hypothetical protein